MAHLKIPALRVNSTSIATFQLSRDAGECGAKHYEVPAFLHGVKTQSGMKRK
jgi:hypothetical protein